jgi:hypothetical protein
MSRFAEFPASWRRRTRVLMLLVLCLFAGLAQAQSDTDDRVDPPTRVARLSYIGGDLGFLPAGAKDWSDARINRPLTTGDKLSSAADARAELQFDGGTLRIDGQTDLGLLDLNDRTAQIELTQGSLSLSVRQLNDGESYEIDTPAVALVVDQPGTFRVDVDPRDGSTRVAALDGAATVFGENNAQRSINPGRSYRFTDASLRRVTISNINRGDAFDRWASERDNRYARSTSRQYVSEDVVGYQDLDQYGGWQDSSEYGAVWYPRNVGSDWAPYRDGHWAYIAPWGWSWVDDAPWGYAPYHYGRWAYTQRGWGWIPGPRGVRAVYAPALVAFVGGGGWSVGISSAPVGWFPLGPGEIYNPWYRCGRSYYTNVNIYNISVRGGRDPRRDIDDHYNRYRRGDFGHDGHYGNNQAPRGFTAVSGRSFGDGHNVNQNRIHVDPRKLVDVPVRADDINRLRPTDRGDRAARTSHVRNLPAGGFDREVVARRAPPTVAEVSLPGRDNPARNNPRERVRVLDSEDASARPSMVGRDGRDPRRPSAAPDAQLPVVPAITRAGRDGRENLTHDGGELRSAHFARPRGPNGSDQRNATPRPGVSYISGNPAPSPTSAETPRPLPATRGDNARPAPYDRERMPREVQQPMTPPERSTPEQRFERAQQPRYQRPEPVQREYQRPEPVPRQYQRPEPVQREYQHPEPVQREYQRPEPTPMPRPSAPAPQSYEPPQRAAPPAQVEAPRQQQEAPRANPKKRVERLEQEELKH